MSSSSRQALDVDRDEDDVGLLTTDTTDRSMDGTLAEHVTETDRLQTSKIPPGSYSPLESPDWSHQNDDGVACVSETSNYADGRDPNLTGPTHISVNIADLPSIPERSHLGPSGGELETVNDEILDSSTTAQDGRTYHQMQLDQGEPFCHRYKDYIKWFCLGGSAIVLTVGVCEVYKAVASDTYPEQ